MTSKLAFFTLCTLLCGLHRGISGSEAASRSNALHERVTGIGATSSPNVLHLTYYAHETQAGPNATILHAVGTGQGNQTKMGWGTFLALDNALKEGNTTDSKLLGSITGTAMVTTIGGVATGGMQINTQHIFNNASMYNTYSLLVIGTISTPNPPYECIIPGGTGLFRGFTGYGILAPLDAASIPPLYIYQWDIFISYKG